MTKDTPEVSIHELTSCGCSRCKEEVMPKTQPSKSSQPSAGALRAEWARPAFEAGLSSAFCRGCNSPNEPGVVLEGGYGRGYWLLSSKGINHPWHASCASKALGEYESCETGVAELLEAANSLCLCLHSLCEWPGSRRGYTIKATIAKLEQAIAKCEGGE